MSVARYRDEHVPRAVTRGLRRRGVDCVTAQEDGRAGRADPAVLQRATELGRVLYTNDVDLLVIASEMLLRGDHFGGVIFAEQRHITIGQAIVELEMIAKASEPEEWRDVVCRVPM